MICAPRVALARRRWAIAEVDVPRRRGAGCYCDGLLADRVHAQFGSARVAHRKAWIICQAPRPGRQAWQRAWGSQGRPRRRDQTRNPAGPPAPPTAGAASAVAVGAHGHRGEHQADLGHLHRWIWDIGLTRFSQVTTLLAPPWITQHRGVLTVGSEHGHNDRQCQVMWILYPLGKSVLDS